MRFSGFNPILKVLFVCFFYSCLQFEAHASLACQRAYFTDIEQDLDVAAEKFARKFLKPDGSPKPVHEMIGEPQSAGYRQWLLSWQNILWRRFEEPLATLIRANRQNFNITLFKGSIYPNQWFAQNRSEAIRTSDLAKYQPWFKWNSRTRSYTYSTSGSARHILESLADSEGNIQFYRGISEADLTALKAIQKLQKKGASPEQMLFRLKKFWEEKDALFFTNNLASAREWSAHVVLFTVPMRLWNRWAQEERIYVGFEYDYPEFALFSDDSLLFFLQNFEFVKR